MAQKNKTMKYKQYLAKALTKYIKEKRNQDESIGFSDGYKEGFKQALKVAQDKN